EGRARVGEPQLDDVTDPQGRVGVVDEEVVVVELDHREARERLPGASVAADPEEHRQVDVDGDVTLADGRQGTARLGRRVDPRDGGQGGTEWVRRRRGAKGGAALVGPVVVG